MIESVASWLAITKVPNFCLQESRSWTAVPACPKMTMKSSKEPKRVQGCQKDHRLDIVRPKHSKLACPLGHLPWRLPSSKAKKKMLYVVFYFQGFRPDFHWPPHIGQGLIHPPPLRLRGRLLFRVLCHVLDLKLSWATTRDHAFIIFYFSPAAKKHLAEEKGSTLHLLIWADCFFVYFGFAFGKALSQTREAERTAPGLNQSLQSTMPQESCWWNRVEAWGFENSGMQKEIWEWQSAEDSMRN